MKILQKRMCHYTSLDNFTHYLALLTLCFLILPLQLKAQNGLFTVNRNDASILSIIKQVEQSSQYKFFYNDNTVDVNNKVSVNVRNVSISTLLNDMFKSTDISYSIEGTKILLVTREHNNAAAIKGKRVATGRVVDEKNEPIIGASVLEKGTTNGVITDIDGKFSLPLTEGKKELSISYVGYVSQDVKIGKNDAKIVLREDNKVLDEVVVVGYGTQRKVNLTGAVSTIKSDQLENRTSSNPINMLTGQVAGVTIVQSSGQPGADVGNLRVRGIGTLGNSEAMVVVDGVESSMSNVDPSDIENISVLKDAAASAIYGVRAANGVIIITTKRGSAGKPIVSYNGYAGWQEACRLPKYLDSYNYALLINEAYKNDGRNEPYSKDALQKFKDGNDPDHYANSDWVDELLSNDGFFTNHHINVIGGNEGVKYSLGSGFYLKNGLIPNTSYNRFNVRSNIDVKINNRLNISLNLSAFRDDQKSPALAVSTIMYHAFRETPVTPIMFQNGNYGLFLNEHNSVAEARNGGNTHVINSNFQGNASFVYKLIDGLSLKGTAAAIYNLKDSRIFAKKMDFYTADSNDPIKSTRSLASNNDKKTLEINLQAYMDYDKVFGKHGVKVLLGYSQIHNQYRVLGASRKDLPSNNMLQEINAGDITTQDTEGTSVNYSLRSVFGRVNYTYDNRYLLEANLRYDGSSRFPKNNRFGAFPSLSAGWRISEEKFFNVDFIDNMKLRASWGQLGNQEISDYSFYNTYVYGKDYSFGNVLFSGISINDVMANTKISWEKTDQVDAGLDVDLFKNRLSFTGDFFIKNTHAILLQLPIPSTVGVTGPMQNAGKVRNTGFELALTYRNHLNQLQYSSSFNFSYVHNEITDLSGGDTPGRSVGDPVNNIYGYVCDGIFKSQEEIDKSPTQVWGAKPGDLKYRDLNGDGVVNTSDRKSLGSTFPSINYGFRLNLNYKRLDLSFLLQGAADVKGIVWNEIGKAFYNGGKVTEDWLDRWTSDNPNASYPRLTISKYGKNYMTSSFWAQNASYLKMRNLQVGYSLPLAGVKNLGITKLRLYCSIDNLFTISGFKGLDPEMITSSTCYPLTRNYSFGINVSF